MRAGKRITTSRIALNVAVRTPRSIISFKRGAEVYVFILVTIILYVGISMHDLSQPRQSYCTLLTLQGERSGRVRSCVLIATVIHGGHTGKILVLLHQSL